MKSLGIKFVRCAFASLFAFAFALAASAEVTIQWFDVTATDITSGGEWDPAAPTVFGSDLLIDSEDAPVTYTPASAVLENDATFTIDICFSNSVSTTDVDVSAAQAAITIVKDESKNFFFAVADNGAWTTTEVVADPATKYTIKIVFDYETSKVSYYNGETLIKKATIPGTLETKVSNASFQGVGTFNNFVGKYEKGVVASITKESETSYYVTFDEAYVAAANGDTIKMLADAEWTSTTFDATKKNVTIDQADGELTINKAVTTAYNSKGYKCKIESGVLKVDFPFAAGDGTSEAKDWEIPDAETFLIFAQGVAAKTYGANGAQYFKQTGTVDLNDVPFDGVAPNGLFSGHYDGNGQMVTNLVFTRGNYRGLFCNTKNATIKNLTVVLGEGGVLKDKDGNDIGFSAFDLTGYDYTDPTEFGGAALLGKAELTTVTGCMTKGNLSGTHSTGGFAATIQAGTVLRDCTNKVNVIGTYTKIGGLAVIYQATGAVFERCVNKGTVTAYGEFCLAKGTASVGCDGVGGLLAYMSAGGTCTMTISDCVNEGIVYSQHGGTTGSAYTGDMTLPRVGGFVGLLNDNAYITFTGANVTTNGQLAVGCARNPQTGSFATVEGGKATFPAEIVLNGTYKLMIPLAAYEFEFGEVGSVSFDKSLYPACAITASKADGVKGLVLRDPVTVGNVTTLTAAKRPTVLLFN